jgi:hypothetical protein
MEANVKTCKKCGETKAIEAYGKSTRTRDGYLGVCRSCLVSYKQQWKQDNPEKKAEYYDNYLASIGKTRYVKKTEEEKRIRDRANQSKWRKADRKNHPEKYKATERKLEWQRQDRLNNPEKWKGYNKTNYINHKESIAANLKLWKMKNKEYVAEQQRIANRKMVDNLQDRYVKLLIRGKKKGALSIDNIPDVLVEAKRLEILIKRRVKNENSNNTTQ